MRARVKVKVPENFINQIKDKELRQIGYMYFIEHIPQLEIAFTLNYCEKTINNRIKEIKKML